MARTPYPQYALTAGFNCAPANVNALIASTQDEINQLLKNGIRAQDLLKFKQAEIATYSKRTNTNEFWAEGIEQSHLNNTPLSRLIDYPKRIDALTAEQVNAVAKKYLSQKGLVAILKPE